MAKSQAKLYMVDGEGNKQLNIFLKVAMISNTETKNNHFAVGWGPNEAVEVWYKLAKSSSSWQKVHSNVLN